MHEQALRRPPDLRAYGSSVRPHGRVPPLVSPAGRPWRPLGEGQRPPQAWPRSNRERLKVEDAGIYGFATARLISAVYSFYVRFEWFELR